MGILICGGNVHDGKGRVLENTDLFIEKTRIKAIGKNLTPKADDEVIQAAGKEVFPGMIDPLSSWGCGAGRSLKRDNEEASDPITPQLNTYYAFDPENMTYQELWKSGITAAGITVASSAILGGMMSVFKSYGDNLDEMLVKENAALKGSLNEQVKKSYGSHQAAPMTRMKMAALFKAEIKKAHSAEETDQPEEKLIALSKALRKEIPLVMSCNTASEIDCLLECLKGETVRLVIGGGYGLSRKLLKEDCGLVLSDLTDGFSPYNEKVDFDAFFDLVEAGKTIALSAFSDTTAPGREILLWNAWEILRQASRHHRKLSAEKVLEMLTSMPAKLLNVDDRLGSLEVQKDADIVIWSANPLVTARSAVETVIISGKKVKEAAE